MATSLEDYFEELMLSVSNRALASNSSEDEIFFDDSIKVLIEDGHSMEFDAGSKFDSESTLVGYQYTPYKDRGLRVDGYEYLPDRELLNLYICHFSNDPEINSLTKTDINQLYANAKRFFEKSLDKSFSEEFKSKDMSAYQVSDFIYSYEEQIKQIKVIFITNHVLSKAVESLDLIMDDWINSTETSIDIWDIRRFYDNEISRGDTESIKIDFDVEFNQKIPALSAHVNTSDYQSYLCVMPGKILAYLYRKYGSRLLEANVRSFLQFRGNVNKTMRNTIINYPDLFFAYNNGITATADNCELDDDGNIKSLTNLQIVNGGQTTAALSRVFNEGKSDLEKVFVQMKLSEIKRSEETEDLVSNISRYANSQNKINESDFFSNHPFHRTIENKSRRILAPKKEGQVRETKWFYERSRGQYQNEINNRGGNDKKQFIESYPKSQLFTKLDVAKVSLIFDKTPNSAVLGAQEAFKKFAKGIQSTWEDNPEHINDLFYKRLIGMLILFSKTRELVMREVSGNSIQPVTAYSLHVLNQISSSADSSLNLIKVWEKGVFKSLNTQLVKIIEFVDRFFKDRIDPDKNITTLSLSKKVGTVKEIDHEIEINKDRILLQDYVDSLQSVEEIHLESRRARTDQKVEDYNTIVVKLSRLKWDKVISFAKEVPDISENSIQLLSIFPAYYKQGRLPTEAQIIAINKIINQLVSEGLDI